MALKDVEEFKLHTVADVATLFPQTDGRKGKKHESEVEQLILAHGYYRQFGEQVLLTNADIRNLFRAIGRNSRASDGQPAPKTDGYVVVLGSRIEPTANVYIGWAPLNGVHHLVDDVQTHSPFKTELLDYAAGTYEDFVGVRERLKTQRDYGNWYYRTAETQKLLTELFVTTQQGNTDDNEPE